MKKRLPPNNQAPPQDNGDASIDKLKAPPASVTDSHRIPSYNSGAGLVLAAKSHPTSTKTLIVAPPSLDSGSYDGSADRPWDMRATINNGFEASMDKARAAPASANDSNLSSVEKMRAAPARTTERQGIIESTQTVDDEDHSISVISNTRSPQSKLFDSDVFASGKRYVSGVHVRTLAFADKTCTSIVRTFQKWARKSSITTVIASDLLMSSGFESRSGRKEKPWLHIPFIKAGVDARELELVAAAGED